MNKERYSADNEYGITLVSVNEKYREQMEPNAAPYKERVAAMKVLSEAGCKTWVSMEPYPTPNLIEQNLQAILETVKFVDKIIFGRTNYCKEITRGYPQHKLFYNEKAKEVINFCKLHGIEYYIKEKTITE